MNTTVATPALVFWSWPGAVIGVLACAAFVEWFFGYRPICSTRVKVIVAIVLVGLGLLLSGPVTVPNDRLSEILDQQRDEREQQREERERLERERAARPRLHAIANALRSELARSNK